MKIEIRGVLEVDQERGVIYFHAVGGDDKDLQGVTLLRICSLPKPIPNPKEYGLIDITFGYKANYSKV